MKKVILGLMFVFLIPFISTHAMTTVEEQQLIQTLLQQIASLQAQLQVLISQGATATSGRVVNNQQLPPDDGTLTGPSTSAPVFKAGDTVSVKLDHLNVRVSPYGRTLGFQLAGALGTVFNGPQRAGDNTNWWQISYKNGISGWSIESGLEKATAVVGQTTGTCSITSFTANGSSYTNSPIGIFVSNPNSLVQTTLSYIANGCNRIELVQTTNGVSSTSLQPDTGNANIIVNPFFVSWSNVTGADSSFYSLKGYSSSNTSVPSDVKTIQLNKTSTTNNLQNTAILASTPTIAVSSSSISPSSLQTLTATFNVVLKALNGTIQMPNSGGFSFKVYKDGVVINTTSPVNSTYSVPSYGVVTTGVTPNTFVIPEGNYTTVPVTFVMQGTNSNGTLIPQGQYSVALAGVQPVSGTVTLGGSSWMTSAVGFPGQTSTTNIPSAPTNVSVSTGPQCGGQIVINWIGSSGATGYKIYRDNRTYLINTTPNVNADSYVFLDSNNVPSSSHSYYVSAYNSAGESIATGSGNAVSASSACASTPAPTVSLSINASFGSGSNTATAGTYKVLDWSETNATACYLSSSAGMNQLIYNRGDNVTQTSSSGSQSVGPINQATTYTITCTGAGGSASASVTINVSGVTNPAPTVTFTASQTSGGYYLLSWTSTNATSCTSSGDGASWGWPSPRYISGGQTTTLITSSQTYTMTCTGPGGSASQSVTVTPYTQTTTVPTVSVTATPASITSGQSATISWTSTNSTNCDASNIPGGAVAAFTYGSLSVSPAQTTTYSVSCHNSAGQTATQNTTVTVTQLAPTATISINPGFGFGSTITAPNTQKVIDWSSTNATSCSAPWMVGNGTSGSQYVSPAQTTTYTVTCTGAGGTVSKDLTITVSSTPVGPVCSIDSFGANTTTVSPGGKALLTWKTSNCDAVMVAGIDPNSPGMAFAADLTGSMSSYSLNSNATFTLYAYKYGTPTVIKTQTVSVSVSPVSLNESNSQANLASVQAGFDALLKAFQEFVNQGGQ